MYGLGQNASLAQQQGMMGYENLLGGGVNAANAANAAADSANTGAFYGMVGAGMQAGATYGAGGGAPSDEASKKEIQALRSENTGLRDLAAAMGVGPKRAEHKTLQQPEFENPAQERVAAAKYYSDNNDALAKQRQQELAQVRAASEKRAAEERDLSLATRAADFYRDEGIKWSDKRTTSFGATEGQPLQPIYPPQPPSDERSKQRIEELEGIVTEYRQMLGGVGESSAAKPDMRTPGEPPTARFADIPAKTWEYDAEPFASQYPGQHVGPTTKDLKANPATAGTVYTGQDGFERPEPTLLGLSNTAAISEMARIQQEQEERLRAYEQMATPMTVPDRFRGGR
jgi:hypothetical protein